MHRPATTEPHQLQARRRGRIVRTPMPFPRRHHQIWYHHEKDEKLHQQQLQHQHRSATTNAWNGIKAAPRVHNRLPVINPSPPRTTTTTTAAAAAAGAVVVSGAAVEHDSHPQSRANRRRCNNNKHKKNSATPAAPCTALIKTTARRLDELICLQATTAATGHHGERFPRRLLLRPSFRVFHQIIVTAINQRRFALELFNADRRSMFASGRFMAAPQHRDIFMRRVSAFVSFMHWHDGTDEEEKVGGDINGAVNDRGKPMDDENALPLQTSSSREWQQHQGLALLRNPTRMLTLLSRFAELALLYSRAALRKRKTVQAGDDNTMCGNTPRTQHGLLSLTHDDIRAVVKAVDSVAPLRSADGGSKCHEPRKRSVTAPTRGAGEQHRTCTAAQWDSVVHGLDAARAWQRQQNQKSAAVFGVYGIPSVSNGSVDRNASVSHGNVPLPPSQLRPPSPSRLVLVPKGFESMFSQTVGDAVEGDDDSVGEYDSDESDDGSCGDKKDVTASSVDNTPSILHPAHGLNGKKAKVHDDRETDFDCHFRRSSVFELAPAMKKESVAAVRIAVGATDGMNKGDGVGYDHQHGQFFTQIHAHLEILVHKTRAVLDPLVTHPQLKTRWLMTCPFRFVRDIIANTQARIGFPPVGGAIPRLVPQRHEWSTVGPRKGSRVSTARQRQIQYTAASIMGEEKRANCAMIAAVLKLIHDRVSTLMEVLMHPCRLDDVKPHDIVTGQRIEHTHFFLQCFGAAVCVYEEEEGVERRKDSFTEMKQRQDREQRQQEQRRYVQSSRAHTTGSVVRDGAGSAVHPSVTEVSGQEHAADPVVTLVAMPQRPPQRWSREHRRSVSEALYSKYASADAQVKETVRVVGGWKSRMKKRKITKLVDGDEAMRYRAARDAEREREHQAQCAVLNRVIGNDAFKGLRRVWEEEIVSFLSTGKASIPPTWMITGHPPSD